MRSLASLAAAVSLFATTVHADPPSCARRVAALKTRLAAVPVAFTPKLDPAPGADAAPLVPPHVDGRAHALDHPGPTLEIAADRVELDGTRLPAGNDFATAKLIAARLAKLPKPQRAPIYVVADAGVAQVRIDHLVGLLPSRDLRVVVRTDRRPPTVPKDAPAWVDDQLRDAIVDPATAATITARALQRAVGDCGPVMAAFGEIAEVAPENKRAVLVADVPAGLAKCSCGTADVEAIGALLELVLGSWGGSGEGWVPLAAAHGRHLFAVHAGSGAVGAGGIVR